jgi:hypothetical protein
VVLSNRINWPAKAARVLVYITFACSNAHSQAQLDARSIDIHLSAPNSMNEMRRRVVAGRYELRNASLIDLIHTAWDIQADNVIGGPEWLATRRFDVSLPVPQTVGAEQLRSILQTMLSDRFHLAVHNTTRDVPVFAITVNNKALATKALIKPAFGSEDSGCRQQAGPLGSIPWDGVMSWACPTRMPATSVIEPFMCGDDPWPSPRARVP